MDTDTILLVGCREGDGGDYGTGLLVWFRPNMGSPRAEAIMMRPKRSSVGEGATVCASGRVFEVRGCRGHHWHLAVEDEVEVLDGEESGSGTVMMTIGGYHRLEGIAILRLPGVDVEAVAGIAETVGTMGAVGEGRGT